MCWLRPPVRWRAVFSCLSVFVCCRHWAGVWAWCLPEPLYGMFFRYTKAQRSISNASGTFSSTLTADIIGTGTTSPISVNLPGTAGTAYKVRVISGTITSLAGTQTLQISGPPSGPPTTSTTVNFCQNQSPSTLSATATGGNTVVWYQSDNATKISSGAPSPNTNVGTNTSYTYYVTQANAGGCEYSPRTQITVNVIVTPAPTVTQSTIN